MPDDPTKDATDIVRDGVESGCSDVGDERRGQVDSLKLAVVRFFCSDGEVQRDVSSHNVDHLRTACDELLGLDATITTKKAVVVVLTDLGNVCGCCSETAPTESVHISALVDGVELGRVVSSSNVLRKC